MVKNVKLESVRKPANRLNTYFTSICKKGIKVDLIASESSIPHVFLAVYSLRTELLFLTLTKTIVSDCVCQ